MSLYFENNIKVLQLLLPILLFSVLLMGCGSAEEKEVRLYFEQYVDDLNTREFMHQYLDMESLEFLNSCISNADKMDSEDIKTYAKASDYPYTLYGLLYYTKTHFIPSLHNDDGSRTMFLKDYIWFSRLGDFGLWTYYHEEANGYRINKILKINGDSALINIASPTIIVNETSNDRYSINADIALKKENGKWKINIPEIFILNEKIMRAKAKYFQIDLDGYLERLGRQYVNIK